MNLSENNCNNPLDEMTSEEILDIALKALKNGKEDRFKECLPLLNANGIAIALYTLEQQHKLPDHMKRTPGKLVPAYKADMAEEFGLDGLTEKQQGVLCALLTNLQQTTSSDVVKKWIEDFLTEEHDPLGLLTILSALVHIRDYRDGGLGHKDHSHAFVLRLMELYPHLSTLVTRLLIDCGSFMSLRQLLGWKKADGSRIQSPNCLLTAIRVEWWKVMVDPEHPQHSLAVKWAPRLRSGKQRKTSDGKETDKIVRAFYRECPMMSWEENLVVKILNTRDEAGNIWIESATITPLKPKRIRLCMDLLEHYENSPRNDRDYRKLLTEMSKAIVDRGGEYTLQHLRSHHNIDGFDERIDKLVTDGKTTAYDQSHGYRSSKRSRDQKIEEGWIYRYHQAVVESYFKKVAEGKSDMVKTAGTTVASLVMGSGLDCTHRRNKLFMYPKADAATRNAQATKWLLNLVKIVNDDPKLVSLLGSIILDRSGSMNDEDAIFFATAASIIFAALKTWTEIDAWEARGKIGPKTMLGPIIIIFAEYLQPIDLGKEFVNHISALRNGLEHVFDFLSFVKMVVEENNKMNMGFTTNFTLVLGYINERRNERTELLRKLHIDENIIESMLGQANMFIMTDCEWNGDIFTDKTFLQQQCGKFPWMKGMKMAVWNTRSRACFKLIPTSDAKADDTGISVVRLAGQNLESFKFLAPNGEMFIRGVVDKRTKSFNLDTRLIDAINVMGEVPVEKLSPQEIRLIDARSLFESPASAKKCEEKKE